LSVPYAVVKQLMGRCDIQTITVAGAGETGELMIKYIRNYLPYCSVRLVNRDQQKLHSLGSRYDMLQFPLSALAQSVAGSDALIVTTNAEMPIVDREHLGESLKIVFDLSVPRNVAPRVYRMNNIPVLDVDAISESIRDTKNTRLSQVPKVEEILARHAAEFDDWMKRREAFAV
ncbi:MAG TPA: hypothetical protein VFO86_13920, partial [Terriglobia bacterium]|nr:hypothetical protein [Terriglobia bacterium]